MGDIVMGGPERGGAYTQKPWPGRSSGGSPFGGGSFGMGSGGGPMDALLKRRLGGVYPLPGSSLYDVPEGLENLSQAEGGKWRPGMFKNNRGDTGYGINAGYYGGGDNTYDYSGKKTGTQKPKWQSGTPGGMSGPSMERLRAISSAAGWSRNPMQRQTGVSQGADLRSPDALRRLLEARMGGGGF